MNEHSRWVQRLAILVLAANGAVLGHVAGYAIAPSGSVNGDITAPRMTRFWITLDQAVTFVASCVTEMQGGEIFVPKLPSMRVSELISTLAPETPLRASHDLRAETCLPYGRRILPHSRFIKARQISRSACWSPSAARHLPSVTD